MRVESKHDPLPHHKAGLSYTRTGYGAKIPTATKVHYQGRWRRVYLTIYSNLGTAWITVDGQKHIVDSYQDYIEVRDEPWVPRA